MKKNVFIGLLGIALLFTGCNSEEKMIQNAAYGYLNAMGNYHLSEAVPFASKETVEETIKVIEHVIMPNMDSTYIKRNTPATIEILEIVQENDTAAVVTYRKTTPIKVQRGTLNLVKRENKWQALVKMNVPQALTIPTDSTAIEKRNQELKKIPKLQKSNELPGKFKREN